MDLEKELQKFNNDWYIQSDIINIYLVSKGVRKGCLIEGTNHIPYLLNLAASLELLALKLKSGNKYIISSPEGIQTYLEGKEGPIVELGKILGYYCYNHKEWWRGDRKRIAVDIIVYNEKDGSKLQIFSEVCEEDKINITELKEYYNNFVDKAQSYLPSSFNVSFNIKYL